MTSQEYPWIFVENPLESLLKWPEDNPGPNPINIGHADRGKLFLEALKWLIEPVSHFTLFLSLIFPLQPRLFKAAALSFTMVLHLTQLQRLSLVIGISLCFFLAEISGIHVSSRTRNLFSLAVTSWVLHEISRSCGWRISLCSSEGFPASELDVRANVYSSMISSGLLWHLLLWRYDVW